MRVVDKDQNLWTCAATYTCPFCGIPQRIGDRAGSFLLSENRKALWTPGCADCHALPLTELNRRLTDYGQTPEPA